jgi:hypothetical protein
MVLSLPNQLRRDCLCRNAAASMIPMHGDHESTLHQIWPAVCIWTYSTLELRGSAQCANAGKDEVYALVYEG